MKLLCSIRRRNSGHSRLCRFHCAHERLQARQSLLQFLDLLLLRLDNFGCRLRPVVLLLYFVQQHSGDVLIANCVGLAIVIVRYEFGIDLGDFFRDEAVLKRAVASLYSGL